MPCRRAGTATSGRGQPGQLPLGHPTEDTPISTPNAFSPAAPFPPADLTGLPHVGGRKADHVHAALKRAILFGQLGPDSQLLEQELAAQFGCSQGTVREALLRLDEDGLVRRDGYRGTRVTETTLEEAAEMVRIRLQIERGVARKLAVAGLGAHRPQLEALIGQLARAHTSDDLYLGGEIDSAFHCALVQAAGRPLLAPLLMRCILHFHRYTFGGPATPRRFDQEQAAGDEHHRLLDTLTAGDPDRAEAAIAGHLEAVLRRWSPELHAAVGTATFAGLRSR